MLLLISLLGIFLCANSQVFAEDQPQSQVAGEETLVADNAGYEEVISMLKEQNKKSSREMRQIKRDIAALGQKMETPGIAEILGGIGYIFGLFGVAAYVSARKQKSGGGQ